MANLKFNEVSWDNSGQKSLMYVEFEFSGRMLRWYPKWKDVADLFSCSFATESGLNRGKLTPFLTFECLQTLIREQFHGKDIDMKAIHEFNSAVDAIRKHLLDNH